jgi:hypothetical protein
MGKRFNPNLAKIHRNHSIEEVATLFGVHKNTVRAWIREGLPISDSKRPTLILGSDLRSFLQLKRQKHKQKCQPCEIYCVKCKSRQIPETGLIEYETINSTTFCVTAICPRCENIINKFVNTDGFAKIQAQLNITIPARIKQLS